MASYCDAKHHKGLWRLRIDDIDQARVVPGSIDSIKQCLDVYGFAWDGDVILQSKRHVIYHDALSQLIEDGLLYHCSCSRKQLIGKPVYPGFCRPAQATIPVVEKDHALRLTVNGDTQFNDKVQGQQRALLEADIGDTIMWRRDSVFAYALVAAVDDSDGITTVIRGADLMDATHIQRQVMQKLKRALPDHGHVPIALDVDHRKLGKQTKAPALDLEKPLISLHDAWHFLGQKPMRAESITEFWHHAIESWDLNEVPSQPGCVHA